jgi:hypothetical protein
MEHLMNAQTQAVVMPGPDVVQFPIVVNGQQVPARVSFECLQDHFGMGPAGADAITAFRNNRAVIEKKAVDKTLAGHAPPALVRSADF